MNSVDSNRYFWTLEKLQLFEDALTFNHGPIKSRFHEARMDLLPVLYDERAFPDDLSDQWQTIRYNLTLKGAANDNGELIKDPIEHTLDSYNNKDLEKLARNLIDLKSQLESYLEN